LSPGGTCWTHVAFQNPGVKFAIEDNIEAEKLETFALLSCLHAPESIENDVFDFADQLLGILVFLSGQKLEQFGEKKI
jgi:hypothetical protein